MSSDGNDPLEKEKQDAERKESWEEVRRAEPRKQVEDLAGERRGRDAASAEPGRGRARGADAGSVSDGKMRWLSDVSESLK